MVLKVYNTLTKKHEIFSPVEEKKVRMYVCGPTVYDSCHIGHAKPYVIADTMKRYLEYKGYKVNHIQNFTDIEDKIIKRANERNKSVEHLSNKYINEFFEDMSQLRIKPATYYPKATEHISEMIDHINGLVDKGFAYPAQNGDVYFSVSKFSEYGKLSKKRLDELQSGARVEVDEIKKAPGDFALWKSSKPEEPSWDSPWGKGRPGWHIECSAMARKHLGDTIDMHLGGMDLVFPHHENEIAQSEALTGKPFSKYWLHNGFINFDNEKMSKSLGNFVTLRDLLKRYDGDTLRFYLLQKHYRSPDNFKEEPIIGAGEGLNRLRKSLARSLEVSQEKGSKSIEEKEKEVEELIKNLTIKFEEKMDDDFDTPGAIAAFFDFSKKIKELANQAKKAIPKAIEHCKDLGEILGLSLEVQKSSLGDDMTGKVMDIILELRKRARENKDWTTADFIRDKLNELEIKVKDKPDGTSTWEK